MVKLLIFPFVDTCQDFIMFVTMAVWIFLRKFSLDISNLNIIFDSISPGRVAQSVGHLTHKSEVLGSTPGLATYFRFSFR